MEHSFMCWPQQLLVSLRLVNQGLGHKNMQAPVSMTSPMKLISLGSYSIIGKHGGHWVWTTPS